MPAFAIGDLDEFEAAAAEVGGHAARAGEGGDHAGGAGAGFFLAGEQARLEAERADRVEKLGTVGGIARGGRRHAFDVLHLEQAQQAGEAAERDERTAHALFGDRAGLAEVAAEAGADLFVEDDDGRAGRPVVDHQTHGVRTDVDDRALFALEADADHKKTRLMPIIGGSLVDCLSARDSGLKTPLCQMLPRLSESFGTFRPLASDAPRPESDGLVMK